MKNIFLSVERNVVPEIFSRFELGFVLGLRRVCINEISLLHNFGTYCNEKNPEKINYSQFNKSIYSCIDSFQQHENENKCQNNNRICQCWSFVIGASMGYSDSLMNYFRRVPCYQWITFSKTHTRTVVCDSRHINMFSSTPLWCNACYWNIFLRCIP